VKPYIVGETNPYQPMLDQRWAMYPNPPQSAGARLCYRILRMDERTYLRTFERRNLLHGHWSLPKARAAAEDLRRESGDGAKFVLLGSKVAEAFGYSFEPFTVHPLVDLPRCGTKGAALILPHPSGLSRGWNAPGSFDLARKLVLDLAQVAA
jgi:hypothetical protein